jgi:hypothetical protein
MIDVYTHLIARAPFREIKSTVVTWNEIPMTLANEASCATLHCVAGPVQALMLNQIISQHCY